MTNWLFPPRQIICVWGELLKWATKKKSYFLLYWLFNRDPYNGSLQSRYNWVVYDSISSATKNYPTNGNHFHCSNEHHDVGERFGGLYIHGMIHAFKSKAVALSHRVSQLPSAPASLVSLHLESVDFTSNPMRLLVGWAIPNLNNIRPFNLDHIFSPPKKMEVNIQQKKKHMHFSPPTQSQLWKFKGVFFNEIHPLASVWHLPWRFQVQVGGLKW